ncbi:MAG: PPC domain-containing protein [Anaerolineae bacterium]|nr:PPC domain-containing protein [Anaerolineae bacterium]
MAFWKKQPALRGMSILILIMLATLAPISAQDTAPSSDTTRNLQSGLSVSDTLDEANAARVYTYTAQTAEQIQIEVTSDTNLVALVTDGAANTIVSQTNIVDAFDVQLPIAGTYYLTIFSAAGIPESEIDFSILITLESGSVATFQEPAQLITQTGIQMSLAWDSIANLDLEIRDSVGGSLRFATPSVASGGAFGINQNSVCANQTTNPVEQATWPAGAVPTGSYELLVYYQPLQDCPTSDPANLTLSATVDGQAIETIEGSIAPGQVFLASVTIGEDGTITTGASGIKVDPPTATGIDISTANPLALGTAVNGSITRSQTAEIYRFTGQANDVITLSMDATGGNLDTLLMILDPNGNIVGTNDDRANGITNAQIQNLTLIVPGEYTVIATRYGQSLGGTEGTYALLLESQTVTQTASNEVLATLSNLPRGSVAVSLQWSTNADIQLLVRDPQGNTLFNDRTSVASGGQLISNGNLNCTVAQGSPLLYAYWPEGRLQAGAYEIEVQYRNQCNDNRPVRVTLNVIAGGTNVISTTTQDMLFQERYVSSFFVDTAGVITAGDGGLFGTVVRPDASGFLPQVNATSDSIPTISFNQTINGSIRLDRRAEFYGFDGEAGQVVSVQMQRVSGTLDPVLFLISPNGIQVTQNDDATGDTRDALINQFALPETGRYIIIATHFGGQFGVTAGDYTLGLRPS